MPNSSGSFESQESFVVHISVDEMIECNKNKCKLYEKRKIIVSVKDFERKFHDNPCLVISDSSDLFYSILYHIRHFDNTDKMMILNAILSSSDSMVSEIESLPHDDMVENSILYQNVIKMSIFVICMLLEIFEAELIKMTMTSFEPKKRKNKNGIISSQVQSEASIAVTEFKENMEQSREEAFTILIKILELPLTKLCNGPVDETLINVVTECCYRLIESLGKWKNKSSVSLLLTTVGICVKNYSNHLLTCALKLIQILQHMDDVSVIVADAVTMFTHKFGMVLFIPTMMQEFVSMFERASEVAAESQENGDKNVVSKGVPVFINEITMKNPKIMFKQLSTLFHLRCVDQYLVRQSVLTAIGDVIINCLSDLNSYSQSEKGVRMCSSVRDKCFDVLEEHIHDSNAFVRARVITIWQKILITDSLPHSRQKYLLEILLGRLNDKSTNVRKSTLVIFSQLLEKNNITIKLDFEKLQLNLLKENDKLKNMVKNGEKGQGSGSSDSLCLGDEIADLEEILNTALTGLDNLQKKTTTCQKIIASDYNDKETDFSQDEYDKQLELVEFMQCSIDFKIAINEIIPIIENILFCNIPSLVCEALKLLVTANNVGLQGIDKTIRQFQSLVMSEDASVKCATLDAFRSINLKYDGPSANCSLHVASGLIKLLEGANLGEYTALSVIVCQLVETNDIDINVIIQLWSFYAMALKKQDSVSFHNAVKSIMILTMIATKKPQLLQNKMGVLMSVGFDHVHALKDLNLASQTCIALTKYQLQQIENEVNSSENEEGNEPQNTITSTTSQRLDFDHFVFEKIETLLITCIFEPTCQNYNSFVKNAINFIYKTSERPDTRLTRVLSKIVDQMKQLYNLEDFSNEEEFTIMDKITIMTISRLLHLAGHVSLGQFVYLYEDVFSELKKRRLQKENSRKARKSQIKSFGDEMGLGAVADDAEYEIVRDVTDNELLSNTHLLGFFASLTKYICSNTETFPNHILQSCATQALTKFMLTSSKYCEDNLNLLFTILEKSRHSNIKNNIIISIDDLCLQYPNLIEPYTSHIYSRLRDKCTDVRHHALMIITKLILNDMIKIKGQISEVAVCLLDPSKNVSSMAYFFFEELSKKGNAVYNVLPEIISRLSDENTGIEQEYFRAVIKTLFSYILKSRQVESLVDKLCFRFRTVKNNVKNWQNLAFCLSLFTYNEKMIRTILENFASIGHTLYNEEILSYFQTILTSAKKSLKIESKPLIDELSDKIHKATNDENDKTAVESQNVENVTFIASQPATQVVTIEE